MPAREDVQQPVREERLEPAKQAGKMGRAKEELTMLEGREDSKVAAKLTSKTKQLGKVRRRRRGRMQDRGRDKVPEAGR